MTLSNHSGEDSFTIGDNSFTNRATSGTPIYERSGGTGGGSSGSSGSTGSTGSITTWSTDAYNTTGGIIIDNTWFGMNFFTQPDILSVCATDIVTGEYYGQVGPPAVPGGWSYYWPNPSDTDGGTWGVTSTATGYSSNLTNMAWCSPALYDITDTSGNARDVSNIVKILWTGDGGQTSYGFLQTYDRQNKTSTWETFGYMSVDNIYESIGTIATANKYPDILFASRYRMRNTHNETDRIRIKRQMFKTTGSYANSYRSATVESRYLNLHKTTAKYREFQDIMGIGNYGDATYKTPGTSRSYANILGLDEWSGVLYIKMQSRPSGIAVFKISESIPGNSWAEKFWNACDPTERGAGQLALVDYYKSWAIPGYIGGEGKQDTEEASRWNIRWDLENQKPIGISIPSNSVGQENGKLSIIPWQSQWTP